MRMYSASGRSRWPIVIGAAVVVVAVGGGIVYATNRGDNTPTAIYAPAAPPLPCLRRFRLGATPAAATTKTTPHRRAASAGKTGTQLWCWRRRRAAHHTTYGAVEVATAFYRWLWQSPYPSQADAKAVSAAIMSASAPPAFANVAAQYASVKNPTGGIVPDGTPFHVSTTNGIWQVSESSTRDRVGVNLAAGYVINGALSPTQVAVAGYTMVWEKGAWHIAAGINVDQTKLANGGTRYTGGC